MAECLLIRANAAQIPLADESVQCVVTSPPYWGLRKYAGEQELVWGGDPPDFIEPTPCGHEWGDIEAGEAYEGRKRWQHGIIGDGRPNERGENYQRELRATGELSSVNVSHGGTCRFCGAWRGGLGLEPTIEMYVAHTVEILREVRRVLRADGVCFWNLGDSYANDTKWGGKSGGKNYTSAAGGYQGQRERRDTGLKPKDLCLIPARVALAAQADGWWVRSDIIWAKPNPMPESCRDRPTRAYEHILMLTKSARYYWDAEAVKEAADPIAQSRRSAPLPDALRDGRNGRKRNFDTTRKWVSTRNLRNVWKFATQPYKGAHFATFPEELVRRCILAATSERGACPKCGKPWERIVKPSESYAEKLATKVSLGFSVLRTHLEKEKKQDNSFSGICAEYVTLGWHPGCACEAVNPVPCYVLDPFGGSGTMAKVALKLNRNAVSIDLAYHDLARERIRNVQPVLVTVQAQTMGAASASPSSELALVS